MDPFYEQQLRDEVIYLHSLWYQAPLSIPLPNNPNLPPSNSTTFKKSKKKKHSKFKPKKVGNFSGKEWPVKPLSDNTPVTQSGWPELKLKPKTQTTRVPTQQELEKHNWNQVQQKTLKIAKEFYWKKIEESEEDENDDDSDDEDDMDEDCDDVEIKDYDFFWNLFNGDDELKGYYVKHCGGGGEFSCLVCGGTNAKLLKKYKDCIALVQHSISIAKTKRIRSHRAYGKVICKVLEWDIDHLPSLIVTDHKSSELQENDVNVANKIVDSGVSNGKAHDGSETVDGESMVCEDSSVVASVKEENNGHQFLNEAERKTPGAVKNLDSSVVANVEEENNGHQVLNEAAEGNTPGAVNNLCSNLSSTMVLEAAPEGK